MNTVEELNVVSLPMRDGNPRRAKSIRRTATVVSLPMRDGNFNGAVSKDVG